MNEAEIVKAEDFGLSPEKVRHIEDAFVPKIEERNILNKIYTDLLKKEMSPQLSEEAKELRKKLVKVRTGLAEIHKTQKDFFWSAGKFVDAWKNKETLPVTQMEERLKEIETHYERIEQERLQRVYDARISELNRYEADFTPDGLAEMEDFVFQNVLKGVKLAYEAKKEQEKKEEEERIERERVSRLDAERKNHLVNGNLWQFREEWLESECLGELTQDKWDEVLSTLEANKEAHDKEVTAQREKALEMERKAKEERQKRIDAENELKRIEEQKEAEQQAELSKGDKDKVKDLINDLSDLKTKYVFKSKKNQKMYNDVSVLIDKVIEHIEK